MYDMPVGTRSTYQIEGMAGMTPEEYITALNERTMNFQRERRKTGAASKAPTSEYFASLKKDD